MHDNATGLTALGRFGWKAQTPTVRQQSADAFAGDIGISTPEVPRDHGDCTAAETACLAMPTGVQARLGEVEAPPPVMDLVAFYSRNLAVPARRNVEDARVLAGKKLFYDSGCIACHHPKFVTRRDAGDKAQAFQLIWPYSDFLLHDMGEGLADGQQVGVATGTEWRTPRSGASASPKRSTSIPSSCMTVAPATSPRRSSGTAARLRPRATGSPTWTPATAPR